jgi:hypothetical protein
MFAQGIFLTTCYFSVHDEIGYENEGFSNHLSSFKHIIHHNLFQIRGVSGGYDFPWLLWIAALTYLGCIVMWLVVVWIVQDPGIIDNRAQDFEEVRISIYYI